MPPITPVKRPGKPAKSRSLSAKRSRTNAVFITTPIRTLDISAPATEPKPAGRDTAIATDLSMVQRATPTRAAKPQKMALKTTGMFDSVQKTGIEVQVDRTSNEGVRTDEPSPVIDAMSISVKQTPRMDDVDRHTNTERKVRVPVESSVSETTAPLDSPEAMNDTATGCGGHQGRDGNEIGPESSQDGVAEECDEIGRSVHCSVGKGDIVRHPVDRAGKTSGEANEEDATEEEISVPSPRSTKAMNSAVKAKQVPLSPSDPGRFEIKEDTEIVTFGGKSFSALRDTLREPLTVAAKLLREIPMRLNENLLGEDRTDTILLRTRFVRPQFSKSFAVETIPCMNIHNVTADKTDPTRLKICLIIRDNPNQNQLQDEELASYIQTVLTASQLRKLYPSRKEKRSLIFSHNIFLVEKSVMFLVRRALGETMALYNKLPYPVPFGREKSFIQEWLRHTTFLRHVYFGGHDFGVPVGRLSAHTDCEIAENAMLVMGHLSRKEQLISKACGFELFREGSGQHSGIPVLDFLLPKALATRGWQSRSQENGMSELGAADRKLEDKRILTYLTDEGARYWLRQEV